MKLNPMVRLMLTLFRPTVVSRGGDDRRTDDIDISRSQNKFPRQFNNLFHTFYLFIFFLTLSSLNCTLILLSRARFRLT